MKKHVGIVMALAFSIGTWACGNNTTSETENQINTDSNSANATMMDSNANTAPAHGMGDSTLFKDSNRAGSTGSANDSVKRIGGSSTSDGDSTP